MTSYFSQLMAQTGLSTTDTDPGQAKHGGSSLMTAEPLDAAPGHTGVLNEPEELFSEIETIREAPAEPQAPAPTSIKVLASEESPTIRPESAPQAVNDLRPELRAKTDWNSQDSEQDESHVSSPHTSLPEPSAMDDAFSDAWLKVFQLAREWVADDRALSRPIEEPVEIDADKVEQSIPPLAPLLVEKQTTLQPYVSQQPDELTHPEHKPTERSAEIPAIPSERKEIPTVEERLGEANDHPRPAYVEQHQELNLTIGSIVVTVEGSPGTPDLRPALQPVHNQDESRGSNRSRETNQRWRRHYLRLP